MAHNKKIYDKLSEMAEEILHFHWIFFLEENEGISQNVVSGYWLQYIKVAYWNQLQTGAFSSGRAFMQRNIKQFES